MAVIHTGDCREVMAAMGAESVDAIVTDPPYGLEFMGKGWDKGVPGVEFWAAMLRILRPGGYLLAFGGTRTYHRMATAIEDAGFEVKDCLSWLYGSGFPKHASLLKPAWEPIVLAKKRGAGALNIEACRLPADERPAIIGTPKNGQFSGVFREGSRGDGQTTQGRWPANVCLDEDAAVALDAMTGALAVCGGPKTKTGSGGLFEMGSAGAPGRVYSDTGGASRFFYVAKASKFERSAGLDAPSIHPTVKPLALMRWLVRLVTPPDGLVLDPFAGSGSTGVACVHEGFEFVGIEAEPDYAEIARKRIAHAIGPVFAGAA